MLWTKKDIIPDPGRGWKTEGRGLSMDENWPAGDNMVINPYMSVGRIPLYGLTTTISVTSVTFKNAHF